MLHFTKASFQHLMTSWLQHAKMLLWLCSRSNTQGINMALRILQFYSQSHLLVGWAQMLEIRVCFGNRSLSLKNPKHLQPSQVSDLKTPDHSY